MTVRERVAVSVFIILAVGLMMFPLAGLVDLFVWVMQWPIWSRVVIDCVCAFMLAYMLTPNKEKKR